MPRSRSSPTSSTSRRTCSPTIAGKPVGRGYHQHVARIERADRALELGPLGRGTADLLAIDFGAARRLKLASCWAKSWPVVETRA